MSNTNKPYKILFLRLDPGSKEALALQGEELARIYQAIANFNLFEVKDLDKSTLSEIIVEFIEFDPDVVHLSGHGTKNALLIPNYSNTENEEAKNSTFLSQADLDSLFGCILGLGGTKPRILFINACLAGAVARRIGENMKGHANCVIGMTNVLNQKLALEFTKIFYTSLAKGNTVSCILDDFNSAITAAQISLQQPNEAGFDPQPRAYGDLGIRFKTIFSIAVEEIRNRRLNSTSPYKGLRKFRTEDSDRFFGRDQFIEQLMNDLENANFLLLLGASGSGKSSVILAGLIPQLRKKWGNRFVKLIFTPDHDPFESLYRSLANEEYSQAEAEMARAGTADTLIQVVKSLKRPDDFWLILVDQFEELFTVSDPEKRDRFIKSLVKLGQNAPPSVKIVATMRADFLDRLSPYATLVNLTNGHRPLITEMQEDELRLAIEQPAALNGVVFETGLVEEIVREVQGQAGYLPLLQYTLDLLWKGEVDDKEGGIQDRTLNTASYRRLGGVRGALQQKADTIYDALSAAEQQAAQRIFLKLVEIARNAEAGTEWRPVRRRASQSEFTDEAEQSVVRQLVDRGLLVSDAVQTPGAAPVSTVEIAHEVLLSSWKRLREWIEQNQKAIALRNRLQGDAELWGQTQSDGDLLSESLLAQALEMGNDPTFNQVLGFNEKTRQFIQASQTRRDRQRQQKERQQRRIVMGLSGFSMVTLILSGFAFFQLRQAERQRVEQLAATSQALLSTQPVEAEVNAIAAMGLSQSSLVQFPHGFRSVSAESSMLAAIQVNREQNRLSVIGGLASMAVSRDNKTIVTGSTDGKIQIWNAETGEAIGQPLAGQTNVVNSVAISADGKTIVSRSEDGIVRLWDAQAGEAIGQPLAGQTRGTSPVAISADGKTIVSPDEYGTVRLWDARTGKAIGQPLEEQMGWITSVAISADGKTIVSGSTNGIVRLWNAQTGEAIGQPRAGHKDAILSVAISADGKTIVSGGEDRTVRLWNAQTREAIGQPRAGQTSEVKPFAISTGVANPVAISTDGSTIVSGGANGTVRLWNAQTGEAIGQPLAGHEGTVNFVAISTDGKTIVSGGEDGTVRLWNARTGEAIGQPLEGHKGTVSSVAISADGKTIVSGSIGETVQLWNAQAGEVIGQPMEEQTRGASSVAISADGKTIVSSDFDGTVQLWNAKTRQAIGEPLRGHDSVDSVAISADGKTIVSGGIDGTVRLWRDQTGEIIGQPLEGRDSVDSVAISADGKTIVSGSIGGTVRLWDARDGGAVEYPLEGHKGAGAVSSLSISADGKTIVSRSEDGTVRLWDAQTRQAIKQPLEGQTRVVNSVAISADGKTIVSGSIGGTVRLWDVKTQQAIGQLLAGHTNAVAFVAISADGKNIVSADRSNVRLWQVSPDQLLHTTCNQLQAHSILRNPTTDVAKEARSICQREVWSRGEDASNL